MCFREITCCDPAILSIMFVHGEDMQLFDIHGKEGVDMIVQMDAIECKKAGSDSLLAARTTLSLPKIISGRNGGRPRRRQLRRDS